MEEIISWGIKKNIRCWILEKRSSNDLEDKLAYKKKSWELEIKCSMVRKWVAHSERKGLAGLGERRSNGPTNISS